MMGPRGRVIGLAFSVLFWTTTVLAHALPGSILIFSQSDSQLRLTLTLPLEDLILAAPALGQLDDAPVDQSVAKDPAAQLDEYFAEHLVVRKAEAELPLTLVNASLQTAENEHVGTYKALVMQFAAPLPSSIEALPLTLRYDAVMHEVRNHRASVYWTEPSAEPTGLADFGFRRIDGKPKSVMLERR